MCPGPQDLLLSLTAKIVFSRLRIGKADLQSSFQFNILCIPTYIYTVSSRLKEESIMGMYRAKTVNTVPQVIIDIIILCLIKFFLITSGKEHVE